jgi:hypothetical protein
MSLLVAGDKDSKDTDLESPFLFGTTRRVRIYLLIDRDGYNICRTWSFLYYMSGKESRLYNYVLCVRKEALMAQILLTLAAVVVWQENFAEDTSPLHQLYDYQVSIVQRDGIVRLAANPEFEGFASAWLHVDEDLKLCDDDALEIRIRDNGNAVRIRYFFLKDGCKEYYAGENIVFIGNEWQKVEIPLKYAMPFFGMEFPRALTPGINPTLYLFIENAVSGNFDAEIDQISIVRQTIHEGEE